MVRSKKDPLESKTKTWLNRHNPEYISIQKQKSKEDEVKKKRNTLSRVRRAGLSASHAVFKQFSPLTDKEGNVYSWNDKYKRLLRNNSDVVRRARDGTLHYIPYEDESDLDDEKFDAPLTTEVDKRLAENVEKLLEGDEELDKAMRKRKVVVIKELTDKDCYWKQLSEVDKKELLKKVRKNLNL